MEATNAYYWSEYFSTVNHFEEIRDVLTLMAGLPEENFHGCKVGEAIRAARALLKKIKEG